MFLHYPESSKLWKKLLVLTGAKHGEQKDDSNSAFSTDKRWPPAKPLIKMEVAKQNTFQFQVIIDQLCHMHGENKSIAGGKHILFWVVTLSL